MTKTPRVFFTLLIQDIHLMKYLAIVLTIAALTFSQNVFACDCTSNGPFLTAAPAAQLVGLVKIKKYLTFCQINGHQVPVSMEVEIVDKYQGPEERKTITVWGDDGALCRPYLNEFKVGNYYVIAFFPSGVITVDTNQKAMKAILTTSATDYEISSCGTYWLSVDRSRKRAIGFLASTQHSVALKQLKKYFKKTG